MDTLFIVMPAYNEADNIETTVAEWYTVLDVGSEDSRLLIVNDGSTDRTWEICQRLRDEYPKLIVIDQVNSGHGPTCLHAYKTALRMGANFIFQTDSDGQTRPDEFPPLWERRYDYALNIGYRYRREDGRARAFVSKILRLLIRLRIGVSVKDPNTPYRLMSSVSLSQWLNYIPERFFLANAVLTAVPAYRGEKICWHPITFRQRQGGVNSINFGKMFQIGIAAFTDFGQVKKSLKVDGKKAETVEQVVIPVHE